MSPRGVKKGAGGPHASKRRPEPEESLDDGEAMKLREVAEYLRCDRSTVFRLVQRGKLPSLRVGVNWWVRRDDLEKWIADRHVRPARARGRKPKSRSQ